jgi:hypothetical protein
LPARRQEPRRTGNRGGASAPRGDCPGARAGQLSLSRPGPGGTGRVRVSRDRRSARAAHRGLGQARGSPSQVQVPAETHGSQQATDVLARAGNAAQDQRGTENREYRIQDTRTECPRPLGLRVQQPPQDMDQTSDHRQSHPLGAARHFSQGQQLAVQALDRCEVEGWRPHVDHANANTRLLTVFGKKCLAAGSRSVGRAGRSEFPTRPATRWSEVAARRCATRPSPSMKQLRVLVSSA